MKYQRLPIIIDAVQWTGENQNEIADFMGITLIPDCNEAMPPGKFRINTSEGAIDASPGYWIIKDVEGNFYPCRDSVFNKTYAIADLTKVWEIKKDAFNRSMEKTKAGDYSFMSGIDGGKHDAVNRPSHYTMGSIEVIDAIESWGLNYHRGNAVKYVARAGRKDASKEIEDLEKAVWYLRREIERLKKHVR